MSNNVGGTNEAKKLHFNVVGEILPVKSGFLRFKFYCWVTEVGEYIS